MRLTTSRLVTHLWLRHACQTFLRRDVPVAGILRRDERVPDAIRKQTPFLTRYPNSLAAQDAASLARQIG